MAQQAPIQKLVYIAHGWNLAVSGEPLVDEAFLAWDNGPVFRSIWHHIRDFGYRGPHYTLADPQTGKPITADLSPQENAIIEHVWKEVRRDAGWPLSKITHEPEAPWSKAYERGRNSPIRNEEIRQHYIALGMAGRGTV